MPVGALIGAIVGGLLLAGARPQVLDRLPAGGVATLVGGWGLVGAAVAAAGALGAAATLALYTAAGGHARRALTAALGAGAAVIIAGLVVDRLTGSFAIYAYAGIPAGIVAAVTAGSVVARLTRDEPRPAASR